MNKGSIDGCQFMIAFIKLSSIRKERAAAEVRERNESFIKQQKFEEERKRIEKENALKEVINFECDDACVMRTMRKLKETAKLYDPSNSMSQSLRGFDEAYLPPPLFRYHQLLCIISLHMHLFA
jgi:hypothetical protein